MVADSSVGFRERLELLCKQHGGRPAFARAAGLPYRSLVRYFSVSEPPRTVIEKIVKAGGVSADWLLFGREPNSTKPPALDYRSPTSTGFSHFLRKQITGSLSVERLAANAQLPPSRMSDILNGSEPFLSELVQIAEALDVSVDQWIKQDRVRNVREEKYCLVPRFSYTRFLQAHDREDCSPWDLKISEGLADLIGDPNDRKPFRRDRLQVRWGTATGNLVYDVVDTDELSALPRGSEVLVDLSRRSSRPGMYLVNWDGARIFRRVELFAADGSRIKLVSDNAQPPEAEIVLDADEAQRFDVLIGRICWRENELP